MRSAARFLGRLILGLGWVAFLLVAILFLAEKTGLLTVIFRNAIAERLGIAGEDLWMDEVALGWFEPSLHVSGLKIGKDGDALLLEDARFGIDVDGLSSGRRPRIEEIEVRGGHVRISPKLSRWIQDVAAKFPGRIPGAARTWAVPSITVRDVMVDLDTDRFGRLPIGQVSAVVRSTPSSPPVLRGRLVPSLSSDPGGSGEIFLTGQEFEPGAFDVHASAAGIPISTEYLPSGTEIEGLRSYSPRGTLALQAEGSFRTEGGTPPRASIRLALTDGEALLGDGRQRIEGLRLDVDAKYVPSTSDDLWSLLAWRTDAKLAGRWQDVPFETVARIEGPASGSPLISCRLHVPRLPATHEMVELLGNPPFVENIWQAIDPRGEVELWLGLNCARSWNPDEPIGGSLAAAAEIGIAGGAGVTYRGWMSGKTGQRDQGFPLPVEGVRGSVVYSLDPARLRPVMVGIVDATGSPGGGLARIDGIVNSHPTTAPPDLPGHGYVEVDLQIEVEGLDFDEPVRAALRGLSGVVAPAKTWEPFNLQGGELTADLRIVRDMEMAFAAVDLGLDVRDLALTWKDLPAPVTGAHGRLEFLSDGRTERGLGVELQAAIRTASDLRATIRYQTDPSVAAPAGGKPRLDQIAHVSVRAGRMSLTGDDKKILSARYPWIGTAMDPHAPRGFADVAYEFTRVADGAPVRTDSEVIAREAEITPSAFPVPASEVRGRVLVTAIEGSAESPATTRTSLAPLIGVLSGDVVVSVIGSFPGGKLRVHAAGLDPANKGLLGALSQAIRRSEESEGLDLTAVTVEGPLDVTGEIVAASEAADASPSFRFFLRENSLQSSKRFRLDRMRGILDLHDRVLDGERIETSLAGTPISLSELRIALTADGFEFTTRIDPVDDLPLDRDHLRPFVDEETLEALLGPLGWQGRIDVDEGRVRVTGSPQRDARLEFSGNLTPSDMQVQLGLPLAIRSASASIEQLIYEGGRVRAVCRIDDLYGTIAGRDLAKASLLLTYVEPRLSIESIEGELEGGEIRTLGAVEGAERGGTAFSIDLEEPFPFQLALDLRSIELAGLFRGLFATSFATRGKVDCRLRITGDTQKILAIQGSGSVHMRESRLWSVPVFRALFSQLGIDDQAVFDRMAANIRVRNGVIYTDDIWVSSPILELVGKGSIDFDGGLKEDLQVRYRLIDRLGPLTRILYAIQNELLSIAVRGDLARPKVILKNPWTSVSSNTQRYRSLPLPGFTPLPSRF